VPAACSWQEPHPCPRAWRSTWLSGAARAQSSKIGELSDGVKSRLVFAMICMARPNMLLLDEPTNHLVRAPSALCNRADVAV